VTAPSPTITAVVCTRHRPVDLERVLRSLAWQDDRCEQVVVIDDADHHRRDETATIVGRAEVAVSVWHKDQPGLTASRNLAIDRVRTDLVLFLDDDVVLRPDYVRRVRDAFTGDPSLVGAGGTVDDEHVYGLRRLRALLMVPGRETGQVYRSGWSSPLPRHRDAPVEHLIGCNMTYRTAVLRGYRFDERFQGYALGEDLELSHRLHRDGHRLRTVGAARLWHLSAPPRHDRTWGYREVAIRPLVAGPRFARPAFVVAALTFAAVAAIRNRDRARGNVAAIRDVLRGRVALHQTVEKPVDTTRGAASTTPERRAS
jgi:GT2 family glycosyltransferase